MIKLYPNINFLFQNLTQSDVILKQTVRVITFLTVYNRKDSPQYRDQSDISICDRPPLDLHKITIKLISQLKK